MTGWYGYHPRRLWECGIRLHRLTFRVIDRQTKAIRRLTTAEWRAAGMP